MKFIRWQDGWFRETVCVRDSEGCSAGDVRRPELCSQQFCPRPSRCCCGRHFNKMGLERTSLFTVQYFLGGEPKGEECISGSSLVSNAYCHMMTFPEQLSWPFLSQGSLVHVQHLPSHLQILLPWVESFGERSFPEYQFPSTKFPFVWTNTLRSEFTGPISVSGSDWVIYQQVSISWMNFATFFKWEEM